MVGAVDIGGTKIAAAQVDEAGHVVARTEWPTVNCAPRTAVSRIAEWFGTASLRGIGVGATGPIAPLTGTFGAVDLLPGWCGFEFARELSLSTGVSVFTENDADAAALGEAEWGAGKNAERFLYVTISTGIGSGFVCNGKLYRGARGAHPEAGHHILDPNGPLCYCGATGCWEALASGTAMAGGGSRTAAQICFEAGRGEPGALRIVEQTARYIGLGLANLVTLYCPDVIALGGGVMQSAELFLPVIRDTVKKNCRLVPTDHLKITPATLGNRTALAGAARVWLVRNGESPC